jgi:hypothetical protein
MRLTLNGKDQYASFDRNKTLKELQTPQFVTLPQLTYDQNALFSIHPENYVQDVNFPERDVWVAGSTPLVNRDFAFASAALNQCPNDFNNFSCTHSLSRWVTLPIQLSLHLDQAPEGQAYLDGKLVPVKEGLKTVAQRFKVNGQQLFSVVDSFDPTLPGVEVQYAPNIAGLFAMKTYDGLARQYATITLRDSATPGMLANFLHESMHAAGLNLHSDSPTHYLYYAAVSTNDMLLNFKGIPTPGEQSTLDFFYQLPLGTDVAEFPAKLK